MSLVITTAKPSGVLKLSKSWADKIKTYAAERQRQKTAEANARAAKAVREVLRDELLSELKGAQAALCDGIVLTVKRSAGADATLTLDDGSKVKWSSVVSLLVGNHTIPASRVATIFGGRGESIDIDITGL